MEMMRYAATTIDDKVEEDEVQSDCRKNRYPHNGDFVAGEVDSAKIRQTAEDNLQVQKQAERERSYV